MSDLKAKAEAIETAVNEKIIAHNKDLYERTLAQYKTDEAVQIDCKNYFNQVSSITNGIRTVIEKDPDLVVILHSMREVNFLATPPVVNTVLNLIENMDDLSYEEFFNTYVNAEVENQVKADKIQFLTEQEKAEIVFKLSEGKHPRDLMEEIIIELGLE